MSTTKAILKGLQSPDVSDLSAVVFGDSGRHHLLLQAMFGPEDGEGEESFDIVVCDPDWLADRVTKEGIVWTRHHLVVDRFDINEIRAFLSQYAEQCIGATWRETATKLARLGHWEFEDYRP